VCWPRRRTRTIRNTSLLVVHVCHVRTINDPAVGVNSQRRANRSSRSHMSTGAAVERLWRRLAPAIVMFSRVTAAAALQRRAFSNRHSLLCLGVSHYACVVFILTSFSCGLFERKSSRVACGLIQRLPTLPLHS